MVRLQRINFILIFFFLALSSLAVLGQGGEAVQAYKVDKEAVLTKSVVVLGKKKTSLPLTDIENMRLISVNFDFNYSSAFDSILNKYQKVTSLNAKAYQDSLGFDGLRDDVKFYDTIIFQVSEQTLADPQLIPFIQELEKSKHVIISFWGSGNMLAKLDGIESPVIWCKYASAEAAMYVAQIIFGGVGLSNELDTSYSDAFTAGTGSTIKKIRLGYALWPNSKIINSAHLQLIDTIVHEAIHEKATPSAVVMVVKNGQVVYNKAFGTRTYETGARLSHIEDIYDLASVTKIGATTLGMMRLIEEGKVGLEKPLKTYIGRTRNTNKANISVRDIMLHQAGFVPFIPFFKHIDPVDIGSDSSNVFTTKVADHYYLRGDYFRRVMWPQILKSPIATPGRYVYSDLSMYFAKEVLEEVTAEHLDQYVAEQFYRPLGMKTAGFNPRKRLDIDPSQIVPTENDSLFRKTLLLGYVHDQGAAMAGGVAGHAGLFASSNDLAIAFQMLLDGGTYGGKQYFKPKTINLFTSKQSKVSRRGLGFDRRDSDVNKEYPSKLASPAVYGHTGYTGTCVWVDPESNLIYIFLSNRINPQVSNKLSSLNIRSRIQDVIYEAIKLKE